jgi:glycosyltransferase involved in cell wall biosynthesis
MASVSESHLVQREALCLVASYSYLAGALALVRSVRRHWHVQPRVYIALLDHFDQPRPGFDELDDVVMVDATELDIPHFYWLAAKFTPLELACTVKPYLLRHVLGQGHACAWYGDTDLLFFAEPAAMRSALADHDMVVTPHLFSPFPSQDAWRTPTIGSVTAAGLLNAGLFALRATPDTERFVAEWGAQVVAPGAWLADLTYTTDQHLFNWALVSVPRVAICRDRCTNIAYWNLHERPLRWAQLDGGADDLWTLDDAPIVCFHFSGYEPGRGRMSEFDQRQDVRTNVNLDRLCAYYDAALTAAHQETYRQLPYGYGQVGDLLLTPALRREIKHSERIGALPLGDWPTRPTGLMRHALRLPGTRTALPRVLDEIYHERREIAAHCNDVRIFPRPFLVWMLEYLRIEHPTFAVIEAGLGLAFHRDALEYLTDTIGNMLGIDHRRVGQLLCQQRSVLLEMMTAADIDPEMRRLVARGHYAMPAYDAATFLRYFVSLRPELDRDYDLRDPARFAPLRDTVVVMMDDQVIAPDGLQQQVRGLDLERSVARVFAYLLRHPGFSAKVRSDRLTPEILGEMAPYCGAALGYSASDLVLVDWWLRACRGERDVIHAAPPDAAAVPGAAPQHGDAGSTPPQPGVRLGSVSAASGAALIERLSRGVVIDDSVPERFADYLDWWWEQTERPPRDAERPAAIAVLADYSGAVAAGGGEDAPADAFLSRARDAYRTVPMSLAAALKPEPQGVNVFGHFRAPIGLGSLSLGAAAAWRRAGYAVREITLTNANTAADLQVDELLPHYAFNYPRNFVVTYPHIDFDLRALYPRRCFSGRENIGYFAWEQRDFHPGWRERLQPYDRLFALSQFAAEAVARGMGRRVDWLPAVVEVDVAQARRYDRAHFGIPPDRFVLGFVCDASSSIERKNPLGTIAAICRAVRQEPRAFVVLKVFNGDRAPFDGIVTDIRCQLRNHGIGHLVVTRHMDAAEVHGLIGCCDVYVSLHRAEGFGYTIAEAMELGVPVVATGYSGNMDFMREENAHVVRYREVVLRSAEGPFQPGTVWAEPDVEHAAALIRAVFEDREAAQRKARQAATDARALLSATSVARRLSALLDLPLSRAS